MLGAGMTSFAVLLEQPKRVSELMLFCMSRAVEICWTLLERRGLVGAAGWGGGEGALLFA